MLRFRFPCWGTVASPPAEGWPAVAERSLFTIAQKLALAVSTLAASALLAPASAQSRGADPQGSGPILAAVEWLQGTMLGNVATAVAVIAVAFVGFMMLTGRMNWRYGVTVIVGCFILFGAASIVSGIQSAAGAAG
ncbi:MAG: TrbC/VirB2 family protein [Parvularculaceae bacterium]|nr:TrbC/VirB2 family protein [Parvularculaceae bacterium]